MAPDILTSKELNTLEIEGKKKNVEMKNITREKNRSMKQTSNALKLF